MKALFWDVLLGRLVPLLFFGAGAVFQALTAERAQMFAERSFVDALHFVSEVASFFFFLGLVLAYVTRAKRRCGAREPVVVVTVAVTMLLTSAALAMRRKPHPSLELPGAILLVVGTSYELYALYHLRRSFAVLPEARELVTTGPYAWSRNPLYVAEIVAMLGMLLPSGNAIVLLIVPVALGQWLRVRWEEKVLAAEFPEYREYAARVGRWVPFVR